jgi:hypothetical protein
MLIVNVPGALEARENLTVLLPAISHAIAKIRGGEGIARR